MAEYEREPAAEDLTRQVEAVTAMHPGISVKRQLNGSLMVFVGPEDIYQKPTRSIHIHALWPTEEQQVPDLVLDVRDNRNGMLTTTLVARFEGGRYGDIEHVHAADMDASEVIEAAKKGTELFEAYDKLPPQAKSSVPGFKANDQDRTVEDLEELYERAGSGMVVGWLVEDRAQYLSVEQYLPFIKYALTDLDSPQT